MNFGDILRYGWEMLNEINLGDILRYFWEMLILIWDVMSSFVYTDLDTKIIVGASIGAMLLFIRFMNTSKCPSCGKLNKPYNQENRASSADHGARATHYYYSCSCGERWTRKDIDPSYLFPP